jgi:serine/threonine protein phosphatase PrpC
MTAPVHLRATAFTHQGAVRAANEDCIAIGDWVTSEPMAAPLVLERATGAPLIAVVADGMGGHAAGEVASRIAAERLAALAARAGDEAGLADLLRDVNAELFEAMREQPRLRGMGTTVAGVVIAPAGSLVFNVGDSRVYRIEGSALVQLSTDDTPGPKLADGRTAAMTSNLVTQSLGGAYAEVGIEPHLLGVPPAARERYLLCSDGLSDLLTRDEIEAGLAADDRTSVQALFEAAMARGGRDNISIIMLDLRRS